MGNKRQFVDIHMILNTFQLLHCFFDSKWDSTANQIGTCFTLNGQQHLIIISFKSKCNSLIFTWFWTLFHFCIVSSIHSERALQIKLKHVSALNGEQHLIIISFKSIGNSLIFKWFWTLFHFCTVSSIQSKIALQIKLKHVSALNGD